MFIELYNYLIVNWLQIWYSVCMLYYNCLNKSLMCFSPFRKS